MTKSLSSCTDERSHSLLDGATLDGTTARLVDVLKRENITRELIKELNTKFAGSSERKAFIAAFNQRANSERVHHFAYEGANDSILISPQACGC